MWEMSGHYRLQFSGISPFSCLRPITNAFFGWINRELYMPSWRLRQCVFVNDDGMKRIIPCLSIGGKHVQKPLTIASSTTVYIQS